MAGQTKTQGYFGSLLGASAASAAIADVSTLVFAIPGQLQEVRATYINAAIYRTSYGAVGNTGNVQAQLYIMTFPGIYDLSQMPPGGPDPAQALRVLAAPVITYEDQFIFSATLRDTPIKAAPGTSLVIRMNGIYLSDNAANRIDLGGLTLSVLGETVDATMFGQQLYAGHPLR